MSQDDVYECDDEDRAEAERLRELYRQRVEEVRSQLEPWRGGGAVTASYSHRLTNSPFTGVPGNSVLEVQLSKPGRQDTASLRCIAVWRVTFLTFWSTTDIQVEYREGALVNLLVSDGERFRVECTDVEVVAPDES